MIKAYRFRLYPTEEQKADLTCSFGAVRYVYNAALAYRSKAYRRRGESVSYGDTVKLLNKLKAAKPWLKETYSQSLQMALRNLDAAFTNFFRNTKDIGYPKFKKRISAQSMQYPQGVKADFQSQMLYFPKTGWVHCVFHRRFEGAIRTVTLRMEKSGAYYASVLVETAFDSPSPAIREVGSAYDVLGIDMGVRTLAVCSDGTSYDNARFLSRYEKRLKKEQKRLSRKMKGSKNHDRQRIKVAKLHEKIANQRKDAIEKATAEIAGKSHAAVAVENLNIKGMTKNHHLAKSVSDASMFFFLARLEAKCMAKGMQFVKVSRWYPSSQACSACGYVNRDLKNLKIREWECPVCHTRHDRDANASLNIAREGYRLIARLPMDGGEVTPVETDMVDDRAEAPKKPDVAEAGRVLESSSLEAPRL